MALSFARERKRQNYMIAVFVVALLIIGVVIYQNFFRKQGIVVVPIIAEPAVRKAEIDFNALENPILSELQMFNVIMLAPEVESSVGKPNPFLPR